MLMCRCLHTAVPTISEQLKPSFPDYVSLQSKEEESRKRQKDNFDKWHRPQSLEPLLPGDQVWVIYHHCDETVVEQTALRSYQVSAPSGSLRRNLSHCTNTEPQSTEHQRKLMLHNNHPLQMELFDQGVAEFQYCQIVWIQVGSNEKWTDFPERGDVVVVHLRHVLPHSYVYMLSHAIMHIVLLCVTPHVSDMAILESLIKFIRSWTQQYKGLELKFTSATQAIAPRFVR